MAHLTPSCPPLPRPQVVMAYTVGIALALMSFQAVPASAAALQWANVFMIGFFLYGPQVRGRGGAGWSWRQPLVNCGRCAGR